MQASLQVIPTEEGQLWWAGKEMQRGKKLQDYVGKNEKTKIVVKLQKVPPCHYFLAPLLISVCQGNLKHALHFSTEGPGGASEGATGY